MSKVLIVIDAQEDFTYGTLRNKEAMEALPVIRKITNLAKENKAKIIYTKDTHHNNYLETQEGKNLPIKHCIKGTFGWELCDEAVVENYPYDVIEKETFGFSGWDKHRQYETVSDILLADEVWMCGFCTDICVMANFQMLKAFYPELPIIIIKDGCAGVTPELHEAALKVMGSCQAIIKSFDELKTEIENDCSGSM